MYETAVFGQPPERVVEHLERIAAGTSAVTIKAYGEHASALLAADPEAVENVAVGFRSRGELLHAVTAFLQSARLYRDQDKDHAAVRAATRVTQFDTQLPPEVFSDTPGDKR